MEKRVGNKIVLKVSGLGVRRGSTAILEGVDWTVRKGEHWIILGANGSGKTSILSALTAYLTPTTGDIELLGHTYGQTNWPELRMKLGLVSSAIRQMMPDAETALMAVISGKYAMGAGDPCGPGEGPPNPPPDRMYLSGGTAVGLSFPGRTPAGFDREGADGGSQSADPG
jgi:hypothetical protein